ncbi:MAG TPA: type 1 glutamine amidotransferase domain-containing protein [Thermoanaerobaculia bacterium]|nr:type 1 glutamine amidotransferase domain-containing protein [Thermoanaerobaculia bacterium]
MQQDLNGRRVAILVTDGFEQVEMTSPREALEGAGAKCVLISNKDGEVQGFKHHDKADKFKVDLALSKADPGDFDAVLLPGGVINGDALRIEKKAQQFVQEMERAGKPIMVICHGGWLLVSSGLVKGHTMTSWPTLQDDIRNAGATWQDKEVIRDRNWVSSRKPDDLPAFNRESIRLLGEIKSPAGVQPGDRESLGVRS